MYGAQRNNERKASGTDFFSLTLPRLVSCRCNAQGRCFFCVLARSNPSTALWPWFSPSDLSYSSGRLGPSDMHGWLGKRHNVAKSKQQMYSRSITGHYRTLRLLVAMYVVDIMLEALHACLQPVVELVGTTGVLQTEYTTSPHSTPTHIIVRT